MYICNFHSVNERECIVLRQQHGYLFLHTISYFHSWDLQLSSVCVIHSNGIIGKMQLD
jgi:hypothetical protein